MSHENARILNTVFGAIVPLLLLGGILFIAFRTDETGDDAAMAALMLLGAAFLMMLGQIAFTVMAFVWPCAHCHNRYFHHFMPYWPLTRTCMNCHEPD